MKIVSQSAITMFLFLLVTTGCSLSETSDGRKSLGTISNLEDVYANPLASDGNVFEGYVYLYVGEGYFAFFPRSVLSDSEADTFDVTVLPGANAEAAALLNKFKTGDRLLIRGRIFTDRQCFTTSSCAPWPHPVFVEELKIIGK